MEEEKASKEKDMQQNAKTAKEDHDTQKIPKELASRKMSLSEMHKTITKKQATQEEELRTAEGVFHKANQTLQDYIKTNDMGEMTVVQGLLDVANSKMEAARKKLEACRMKKELVDTKRRKVTNNIVAPVQVMSYADDITSTQTTSAVKKYIQPYTHIYKLPGQNNNLTQTISHRQSHTDNLTQTISHRQSHTDKSTCTLFTPGTAGIYEESGPQNK